MMATLSADRGRNYIVYIIIIVIIIIRATEGGREICLPLFVVVVVGVLFKIINFSRKEQFSTDPSSFVLYYYTSISIKKSLEKKKKKKKNPL